MIKSDGLAASAAARPMPASGTLRRQCACGMHTVAGATCAACSKGTPGAAPRSPQRPLVQARLAIGSSDAPLEREADRIADQVLAGTSLSAANRAPPHIQRYSGQSSAQEISAPASVERVLAGAGVRLDVPLRQEMEQRFGRDFSTVRVHSGSAAQDSARELRAHAYTVANNIVFGAGRFAPATPEGRHLIAHELTHVVQQSTGAAARVDRQASPGAPPVAPKQEGAAPFFGMSAAPDAFQGIVLEYNVAALPHAEGTAVARWIKRGPYSIKTYHRRNADGSASIMYYNVVRTEAGLVGPTDWTEYYVGPDAIEHFLSNLQGYAGAGAGAYMFGRPAPNAIEAGRFVDALMAGEGDAAAKAYGRSLHESVKDPHWWLQMMMAASSLARGPVIAPRAQTPGAPLIRPPVAAPAVPPVRLAASGGGASRSVLGRVGGEVYAAEGGAARAVTPGVNVAPAHAPPQLRIVPTPAPAPAAAAAAAPAAPTVLIPPPVAATVTALIAVSKKSTKTVPSPYTSPKVGPEPEAPEESGKRGCIAGTGPQLGGNSCHDAFAASISGVPREFTLRTPEGQFESFDALGTDRVLYEMKTGNQWLAFGPNSDARTARINGFIEQSERQLAVATRCGYALLWVFNNQAVKTFFDGVVQPRVVHQPFPCEIDSN